MNEKEEKIRDWFSKRDDTNDFHLLGDYEYNGANVCYLILQYLNDHNLPLSSKLHDGDLPDVFNGVYQARLTEAVKIHGKIRYLHNKGVICKSEYRAFVAQIQGYLGIVVPTYVENE